MSNLTYGSICSGIEAASQAWHPLGWKPVWFSQFDPEHNYKNGLDFPSRVLAHHYPDVLNVGDMHDLEPMLRAGMIEAPDVLVGGPPCQGFSVAGLRKSLDDPRSQLTLRYVEFADAVDEIRIADGKEPSIIVYENVPGLLSPSHDDAFGCFIGALAGEPDKLYPPTDKRGKPLRWPDAGCVVGAKRTLAWRILDAQYFGLAQRRRRVFVVASAREDFHPAQVLPEWDGVFRDTPPSRETGEKITADAATGVRVGSHWDGEGVAHPTLGQSFDTGGIGQSNQELFSQRGSGLVQQPSVDVGRTLLNKSNDSLAFDMDSYVTCTARAEFADAINIYGGNPRPDRPNVVIALAGNTIGREPKNGGNHTGFCETGECYTLTKTDVHGVVVAFSAGNSSNAHGIGYSEEHTPPLRASSSGTNMTPTVAYRTNAAGQVMAQADVCATLNTQTDPTGQFLLMGESIAFQERGRQDGPNLDIGGDIAYTLTAPSGGGRAQERNICTPQMQVRRLTPRECERLQGFPDDYSLITGDMPISKVRREKLDMDYVKYLHRGGRLSFEECMNAAADGPRYKALGNSFAVPVVRWIGERIELALREPWPELIATPADNPSDLLAFFDTPDSIAECPTT